MSDEQRLEEAVREALRRVDGPDGRGNLVQRERVRRLEATERGLVRFSVALRPGESARLVEAAREAATAVEGVAAVRVALESVDDREPWSAPEPPSDDRRPPGDPSRPVDAEALRSESPPGAGGGDDEGGTPGPGEGGGGRSLPVVGQGASGGDSASSERDRRAAAREPGDAPPLEGVDRVVAVSSGKGGVGKSTVATNLAVAWAERGHAVGLLDGDVYGPDIPAMFGLDERPGMEDEAVVPPEAHGVKLMSLGFIVDEDTPAIVRGPMLQKIVRQFLKQVRWGELEYLVVDLPPGTGDAQLSLSQLVRLDGGVFVTTPEDVAVGGVRKGVGMFERLEVPVLGVVENMSGFVCPDCGSRHDIFGSGGGERVSASLDLPFLGKIPLGTAVREEAERGRPTVLGRPDSPEAEALRSVAERARRRVEEGVAPGQSS